MTPDYLESYPLSAMLFYIRRTIEGSPERANAFSALALKGENEILNE